MVHGQLVMVNLHKSNSYSQHQVLLCEVTDVGYQSSLSHGCPDGRYVNLMQHQVFHDDIIVRPCIIVTSVYQFYHENDDFF